MTPEYVNEVVMKMVKIGFFDEKLFNDYGILTSEDIQKQFFFVAKNRTNITVQREYLLVSRNLLPRFTHFNDDLDNAEENVNNCENTSDFAERKGKERKERIEKKVKKEKKCVGGIRPRARKIFWILRDGSEIMPHGVQKTSNFQHSHSMRLSNKHGR